MHPHPKVAPVVSPPCVYMSRVNMCVRACTHVSACVKRDVATQAGMQFRNARVAHEESPTLLLLPLPSSPARVLSSLQEETRAKGGDGYQEGTGIP